MAVTFVDNHDSQPLQALESYVEFWFRPLAYALILLREEGCPCLFYIDLYGASYEENGEHIELVSLSELPILLNIRKTLAYGEQCR
jgi:alpha-amylase